jgi:hypothetical protein
MNKSAILNNYYNKNNDNNDFISLLSNYYSNYNNLNLIFLNLLSENNKYWFLCNKTSEIYLFNIILDISNIKKRTRESNEILNSSYIENTLSKLNRFYYKQIDFYIIKSINKINDKFIHIIKCDNIYYNIKKNLLNKINKIDCVNDNQNKKRKISHDMIAASSVRNYMLNDPILDYLKFKHDKPNYLNVGNIKYNNDKFTEYIMKSGEDFETELYNIIKKKFKKKIIKIAEYYESKSIDKYNETINSMKKGIPIIYQAVLHNKNNDTFGLPDLLVRSDYINKLLGYKVINNDEANLASPKLNTKFHYKVIDIKHSTINLRSDGIHILNSESIPAYKGQLYIYTSALNNILGININKAFIWGKKYDYYSKGKKIEITNFLNKLGVIDYDNVDIEYVTFTNNAIEWQKTLKKDYSKWSILPKPSCNELYPNMKNEKDGNYKKIKNDIGNEIYEITNIWNCGVKKRQIAHYNNIFRWDDPLCTAEKLGFGKTKIASTIDKILDINRQYIDIIRPTKVLYDRENWNNSDNNILEFYLDFETLNSNFGSIIKNGIISYDNNQFIFMIGVGYNLNNIWKFKTFVMDKKTNYNEILMFDKFYAYINYLLKFYNKKIAKFYHWSYAEISAYNKFKDRCNLYLKEKDLIISNKINYIDKILNNNYIFYDLNKVFISEPITIKGALNFSIKTIAKALFNCDLIKSFWNINSPCSNGLYAMILANKLYDNNNKEKCIINDPIMKEIIYYNEIDCKVLMEIHNLLKNKL